MTVTVCYSYDGCDNCDTYQMCINYYSAEIASLAPVNADKPHSCDTAARSGTHETPRGCGTISPGDDDGDGDGDGDEQLVLMIMMGWGKLWLEINLKQKNLKTIWWGAQFSTVWAARQAHRPQKNVSRDTYLFVVIFSSILQCSMVCKWILSLTLLINDDGKWKPSNPKDGDDGDEWPCNDCTWWHDLVTLTLHVFEASLLQQRWRWFVLLCFNITGGSGWSLTASDKHCTLFYKASTLWQEHKCSGQSVLLDTRLCCSYHTMWMSTCVYVACVFQHVFISQLSFHSLLHPPTLCLPK